MNAEFISMLDYLERERGNNAKSCSSGANALLSASKRVLGRPRDLRIDITRKTRNSPAANLVVVDQVKPTRGDKSSSESA